MAFATQTIFVLNGDGGRWETERRREERAKGVVHSR